MDQSIGAAKIIGDWSAQKTGAGLQKLVLKGVQVYKVLGSSY